MQCFVSHSVDVAAAALRYQPFHDHVHTALAVRAPDTAAEGKSAGSHCSGHSPQLPAHPSPSPASPGLPFDLSEITHTDCHKDACVEVPCHLEAGVIGLWSAEEKRDRTTTSLSWDPDCPTGLLSLEQLTECLLQVLGAGGVFTHPLSLSEGCEVRAGPLATHRSWPSSVGDGNASSSRPMLMRTWLVSGHTWGTRGRWGQL